MSDTNQRRKTNGYIAAIIAVIASIALGLFIFVNRQYVVDQINVWDFQPSSDVVSFTDRTGMNQTGIFYFYTSHPVVENAQDFNTQCGKTEQSTAILGCYTNRNIYVYNVTNAQLDGIREVTAAHEMLHAAYDRMSDSEKQTVDALLEAEYTKLKSDKAFADQMAFYDRTEPGERDNELHSVIGTEVASISPALEDHYRAYFTDRSKVVALHTKYAAVFSNLQTRAQQLSDQLTQLSDSIKKDSTTYNQEVSQLNSDINTFNSKASGGSFTTNEEFQAERARLVLQVSQLDTFRTTINTNVTLYNTLRAQLADISSQSDALNKSIDSSLAPAPSLKL